MDTRELHHRVKQVVGVVLECAPAYRSALLAERCGNDEKLRREVESLLEFEESLDAFSGEPLVSLRRGPREPRRVGPYEIVERLGHGGMGAVYLAQQEEPFRRQVALKLIHRGLGSDEMMNRFRLEREVLANLEHPSIARILDGGTAPDGRPYFAMEYVDGRPIDEYCDDERLSVRERLELFGKVCSAVELSHQNLVLHCDLKPANILVDASGTPKLLDFGIAKLLRPEPGARTAFVTAPGRPRPMTHAYASPEMVRGESLTTASDIYSLGVLLYRLLSGRHPYLVDGCSFSEIERTICEEEPKRPSTAVTRPGALSALRRELAGDLDAIVLKALRKERRERYGSVVELSEDVGRHLTGLPVAARAGTFRYLAGKLVRRHRWKLGAALTFLLLVLGFAGTVTGLYRETLGERNRARMSRDLFVELLESQAETESLSVEDVVQRGVDLYDESFRRELEVQADVYDSLGLVHVSRGHYRSAEALFEESLRIRREIFGADHVLVGESLLNQAHSLELSGRYAPAERFSGEGLEILRRHYEAPHRELAKAMNVHASQLYHLGEYEAAESLYREALEMKIELYGEHHLEVATSFANMGTVRRASNDPEGSLGYYRRALRIRGALLPATHPKLALSYNQIGSLLTREKSFEEAVPFLRKALEIRTAVLGADHPHVAGSHYCLAICMRELGRYDEAEQHFRESRRIRCATYGENHDKCLAVKENLASLLSTRERER